MARHRWLIGPCAALALLAGCAEKAPERPKPPEGVMGAAARLAAPPAEAVEVVVFDVPPGRRVERIVLIDPNGGRHEAATMVPTTRSESTAAPGFGIGVGVTGGSSSRVTPSLSLGWSSTGDTAERTSRRIAARVPIPDPAAYRQTAARWRIEVEVVEIDGERRTLDFPAGGP